MRAQATPTTTSRGLVVVLEPCPGCGRRIRLEHVGVEVDGETCVDVGAVAAAGRVHTLTCAGR